MIKKIYSIIGYLFFTIENLKRLFLNRYFRFYLFYVVNTLHYYFNAVLFHIFVVLTVLKLKEETYNNITQTLNQIQNPLYCFNLFCRKFQGKKNSNILIPISLQHNISNYEFC